MTFNILRDNDTEIKLTFGKLTCVTEDILYSGCYDEEVPYGLDKALCKIGIVKYGDSIRITNEQKLIDGTNMFISKYIGISNCKDSKNYNREYGSDLTKSYETQNYDVNGDRWYIYLIRTDNIEFMMASTNAYLSYEKYSKSFITKEDAIYFIDKYTCYVVSTLFYVYPITVCTEFSFSKCNNIVYDDRDSKQFIYTDRQAEYTKVLNKPLLLFMNGIRLENILS